VDIKESMLEVIGNTPMVKLGKVAAGVGPEICVKLEYLNPSGSIKDRIALYMITGAEREGRIKPGDSIVEASSGNTGIALSFVSAVKGYPLQVYTPSVTTTPERVKIIQLFGAAIHPLSVEEEKRLRDEGAHGARVEILPRKKCLEIETADPSIWWARQYKNPENVRAHRETTGQEIIRQTDGRVDAFLASVGTGGTLLGVAEALREAIPDVYIVGVEPAGSPHLLEKIDPAGIIPGVNDGLLLEIRRRGLVNEVIAVGNSEAIATADRLAREEGILCGISGGANVFAALQLAERWGKGKRIVTVLPDHRDRYFTTEKYVT